MVLAEVVRGSSSAAWFGFGLRLGGSGSGVVPSDEASQIVAIGAISAKIFFIE
jgi:hypothetical protein